MDFCEAEHQIQCGVCLMSRFPADMTAQGRREKAKHGLSS